VGALLDEVAFELRQRPKHVKHQFATAGCRIEVFLETLEANTPLRQVRDDLDEMAERAPEAVQLPDQEHVAFAQVGEHGLQDGALDSCPTDDLLIHLPAAGLPEGVELEGEALLLRAHPGVPNLHRRLHEFGIPVVFTSKDSKPVFQTQRMPGGAQKIKQETRLAQANENGPAKRSFSRTTPLSAEDGPTPILTKSAGVVGGLSCERFILQNDHRCMCSAVRPPLLWDHAIITLLFAHQGRCGWH
jgi:hypothetical protein